MLLPRIPSYDDLNPSEGKRPTVFIASDDGSVLAFVRVVLEDGGYDVVGQATDGVDALAEIGRHRPDVVVLDESMSIMRGSWGARLIRDAIPEALIVICRTTPTEVPAYVDAAVEEDAVPYLPLTLDRLVR